MNRQVGTHRTAAPRLVALAFLVPFSASVFASPSTLVSKEGFHLAPAKGSPQCAYALLGSEGHLGACGFRVVSPLSGDKARVRCAAVSYDRASGRLRDRIDFDLIDAGLVSRSKPVHVVDDPLAKLLGEPRLFALAGDRVEIAPRIGATELAPLALELAAVSPHGAPLPTIPLDLGVTVLRDEPGGFPALGTEAAEARRAMWHQLRVVDEVMSQCGLRVPFIVDVPFRVSEPPEGTLLTIGDPWGLTSQGGHVRVDIEGEQLGPWEVPPHLEPSQTAHLLASRIARHGYRSHVHTHPRMPSGHAGPADLVVRRKSGRALKINAWAGRPISTDKTQPIRIGHVALGDGLSCYDHLRERFGTVEERALIQLMHRPRDTRSIEVIVVPQFCGRSKQGEAFIQAVSPALGDTVIIDAGGALRARHAFVLAHEIGHVLLKSLEHPAAGPESTDANLMSPNTSAGLEGPRRLTPRQCEAMRRSVFDQKVTGKIKETVNRNDPLERPPARKAVWRMRDKVSSSSPAVRGSGRAAVTTAGMTKCPSSRIRHVIDHGAPILVQLKTPMTSSP